MVGSFPRRYALFAAVVCLSGAALAASACSSTPVEAEVAEDFEGAATEAALEAHARIIELTRDRLSKDIYHYTLVLGDPGSPERPGLGLHRIVREQAPWIARRTPHAALLLHGDFSSFVTSFAPAARDADAAPTEVPNGGMAPFLAGEGIDVWGIDRRWTGISSEELPALEDMGVEQALEDTRTALAFARTVRHLTGSGAQPLTLMGFSSGAVLAYAAAAEDAARSPGDQLVKNLVPLDYYARIAPEDDPLREGACQRRNDERALIEAGTFESDNGFFIELGRLARVAPEDASPFFEGATNRQALLITVGQTYLFFAPTPAYHLAGTRVEGELPVDLRFSGEPAIWDWLEGAAPYQALREILEVDALLCNEAPLPVPNRIEDIRVPVLYAGAAGGVGTHGAYSTEVLGSDDVTTFVVRELGAGRETEDVGHADLLFGMDARSSTWRPIADWIRQH